MNDNKNRPVVLCIMDGWGIDKDSDFNAVTLAKTPNVNYLSKNIHILLLRHLENMLDYLLGKLEILRLVT